MPSESIPRPGCHCDDCLAEDEVYHLVCHECAEGGIDALDIHDYLIAGASRVEWLVDAHWHDNQEYALVWETRDE